MTDIVERLRRYKKDRSGYAVHCHRAADEIKRLQAIEKAATELLSRKDQGPSENAHTFAEWDTMRDALKGRMTHEEMRMMLFNHFALVERDKLQRAEIKRLRATIQAAPDPAFYKPDELAGAWEKWHSAVLRGKK